MTAANQMNAINRPLHAAASHASLRACLHLESLHASNNPKALYIKSSIDRDSQKTGLLLVWEDNNAWERGGACGTSALNTLRQGILQADQQWNHLLARQDHQINTTKHCQYLINLFESDIFLVIQPVRFQSNHGASSTTHRVKMRHFIFSLFRQFKYGRRYYTLSAMNILNLLLPLLARNKNRNTQCPNSTNSLNPICRIPPTRIGAPSSGDETNQANKRNAKGHKNRSLLENFSHGKTSQAMLCRNLNGACSSINGSAAA